MKRKLLLTTFAVCLSTTPVFATGYVTPTPTPAPVPVPVDPGTDWTGFYAGVSIGSFTLEESDAFGVNTTTYEGTPYTIFVGYLHDLGDVVVGGEVYLTPEFDVDPDFVPLGTFSEEAFGARALLGYDLGTFMPYVSLGVAQRQPLHTLTAGLLDHTLITYGIGAEIQVTDRVRIGVSYERGYDDERQFTSGGGTATDINSDTFALRASFNF